MRRGRRSYCCESGGHDKIGIWGFGFNLFGVDEGVAATERLRNYPFLFLLIKLQPGERNIYLESINIRMDGEMEKLKGW